MSNRLYRILTWSEEQYLEDMTKTRFFRLRSAGKKAYQEFLSVKEKFDELKNYQLIIIHNCTNCPFSDTWCPKTDSFFLTKNHMLHIFNILKIWHEL